jgi:hypothetical protein
VNWGTIGPALGVVAVTFVCVGMFAAFVAAEQNQHKRYERQKLEAWNGPCADSSTLVATTTGSPSNHECTNKQHKMRVQVTTLAGEKVGALVLCECREAGK